MVHNISHMIYQNFLISVSLFVELFHYWFNFSSILAGNLYKILNVFHTLTGICNDFLSLYSLS